MQYKIVAAVLASFAFGSALANPIDNAGVQARGEQADQVEQNYPCCGQPHPNWNYRPYWLDGRQFQPRQQGYNYNYANQKGYYENTQFSGSGFDNRGGW